MNLSVKCFPELPFEANLMLYIALLLSAIFFSLGFIVTKNNAKYILSGYNTMSEEERAKVDIEALIQFMKRFHVVLGISLLVGTTIIAFFNNNWASVFMIMYPLVAYLYMIIKSGQFYAKTSKGKWGTYIGGAILTVVIGVIGYAQLYSYESNDLLLKDKTLEINGMYGMEIKKNEIVLVELVEKLPEISYKSNGFAAGDYAKGSFKLKGGKTAKLFVNKKVSPIILLKTTEGEVYYNTDVKDMAALYKEILTWRSL